MNYVLNFREVKQTRFSHKAASLTKPHWQELSEFRGQSIGHLIESTPKMSTLTRYR